MTMHNDHVGWVLHEAADPFPMELSNGTLILDETCACGHLRSGHHDTVAYGHGACASRTCPCQQFTWMAHVT